MCEKGLSFSTRLSSSDKTASRAACHRHDRNNENLHNLSLRRQSVRRKDEVSVGSKKAEKSVEERLARRDLRNISINNDAFDGKENTRTETAKVNLMVKNVIPYDEVSRDQDQMQVANRATWWVIGTLPWDSFLAIYYGTVHHYCTCSPSSSQSFLERKKSACVAPRSESLRPNWQMML